MIWTYLVGSVLNLDFSKWDRTFKDPLTTATDIDRMVQHCTAIEFGTEMESVCG